MFGKYLFFTSDFSSLIHYFMPNKLMFANLFDFIMNFPKFKGFKYHEKFIFIYYQYFTILFAD